MNFIEAIKMVYENGAVVKRENASFCIYKSKKTDCLRKLSFNKKGEAVYKNYSLLLNTTFTSNDWIITNEYHDLIAKDNLVDGNLFTPAFPKKIIKNREINAYN